MKQYDAKARTPTEEAPLSRHLLEVNRLTRRSLAALVCGLIPALAWISFAPLTSAVVASAYVKVDLNRRPVQHPEGGVVREVHVRDGQRVEAGQVLLTLGSVAVDADAQRFDYRVAAEQAGIARLEAEESGQKAISNPMGLIELARRDDRVADLLVKERTLFQARRSSLLSQTELLHIQRDGLSAERQALTAQISNVNESLQGQRSELLSSRQLHRDGFISGARVNQLEASIADYGVKLEEKRAEVARVDQRAAEIDLRIKGLENDYRQQASDQIKAAVGRLSDLEQERRKSDDIASRQTITAPVAGEIMNLKFNATGAVIAPRETIADIVPATPRLVVEAAIRPTDVSRVTTGSLASVRFLAYQSATMPPVEGHVIYVSPDRVVDPATRTASYSLLVEIDPISFNAAGSPKLMAGMPAEIYVTGERRTALSYLLQPVTDILRRSAREG